MPFQNPLVTEGEASSLVGRIESDIIIPGTAHEQLWVHPELVSSRDNPDVCEVRAVETDRHGRDRHTRRHYFRTEDDFRRLVPLAGPTLPGWRLTALRREDVAPAADPAVRLPEDAGWSWYMNYLHLDERTILQPFYTRHGDCRSVGTLTARLAGNRATLLHVSNQRTNNHRRGFLEPHIVARDGRHFMTVRAEDGHGYLLVSGDGGRSWDEPRPWTWDDREPVAMDTTMTKLLAHSEGLLLVYTRVREDNRQYFRHRTPLHCADVDPETLRLRRATERIIVPNRSNRTGRGARSLGNFWAWPLDARRSYVVVTEWPRDGQADNGDTWLARIHWRRPAAEADSGNFPGERKE